MRKSTFKIAIRNYEKIYGPLNFGDLVKIKTNFYTNLNNKIGVFIKYNVQNINFLFVQVLIGDKIYSNLIRGEIESIK